MVPVTAAVTAAAATAVATAAEAMAVAATDNLASNSTILCCQSPPARYPLLMWIRVSTGLMAMLAFLGFFRIPNPDTFILAWAGLMVLAVWSEEIWEKFKKPPLDSGPLCPQCGYDVRATPIRCPECGLVLDSSAASQAGLNHCSR